MKNLLALTVLLFSFVKSFEQKNRVIEMIDSLKYLKSDTLDSKADLYWRIIAQGKEALPFLIEKLDDTSKTNVSFHCKSGKLNVGEVSFFAIEKIAPLPIYPLLHIQFDVFDADGCWSFYQYFFNQLNKAEFKNTVRKWYENNKDRLTKKTISKKNREECLTEFRIRTYYSWWK